MRSTLSFLLILAFATALSAQQQTKVQVYSQYFTSYSVDSTPPNLTLRNRTVRAAPIEQSPRGMKLLGRLAGEDSVIVQLSDLPKHQHLKVSVGFHIIGSWDGEHDNDRLTMMLDGKEHLSETFSNTIYRQSFPGLAKNRTYPARTGARNSNMLSYRFTEPGVYDGPMDATYIEEIEIDHTSESFTILVTTILRDVRKGLDNESWGLEHISVTALGEAPAQDMFPHIRQPEPERIWDHEEIVNFDGPDERAVAGFRQNEDLPGVLPGSPWETESHAVVLRTKCMSCGMFCMMYTIVVYSDNWVNIWSNREPYGVASWSSTITRAEVDTIRACVLACLNREDMASEYEAEDIFDNPDQPHCEFTFRAYGKEREVHIYGGEPPEISEALTTVMRIMKRHHWEPTPFSEEGESGH